jgi:hypothetical protein
MDLLEREERLLQETDLREYHYVSSLQQQIIEKKAEMRHLQQQIDLLEQEITKCIPRLPVSRVDQLRQSLDLYNRDLRIGYLTGQLTRKEFNYKLSRRRKKYTLYEKEVLDEIARLTTLTPDGTAVAPDTPLPPVSE